MTALEESYRTARHITLAGIGVSAILAASNIIMGPTETIAESQWIGGHVRATLKRELSWVADVLVHVEPGDGLPGVRPLHHPTWARRKTRR